MSLVKSHMQHAFNLQVIPFLKPKAGSLPSGWLFFLMKSRKACMKSFSSSPSYSYKLRHEFEMSQKRGTFIIFYYYQLT